MQVKEVLYKGVWLQKGSQCYELYHDKKDPEAKKKLERLHREVCARYSELTYGK
jgi:hypothetical protein